MSRHVTTSSSIPKVTGVLKIPLHRQLSLPLIVLIN